MQHFPHQSAGRGHMPPLSAFGWFVDARCASHRRVPTPEDPELLASLAAEADPGEPVAIYAPPMGARIWRLIAQWFRRPAEERSGNW